MSTVYKRPAKNEPVPKSYPDILTSKGITFEKDKDGKIKIIKKKVDQLAILKSKIK